MNQAKAEHDAMKPSGTYQTVAIGATGTPCASPPWHTKDRADQETAAFNNTPGINPTAKTVNRPTK